MGSGNINGINYVDTNTITPGYGVRGHALPRAMCIPAHRQKPRRAPPTTAMVWSQSYPGHRPPRLFPVKNKKKKQNAFVCINFTTSTDISPLLLVKCSMRETWKTKKQRPKNKSWDKNKYIWEVGSIDCPLHHYRKKTKKQKKRLA